MHLAKSVLFVFCIFFFCSYITVNEVSLIVVLFGLIGLFNFGHSWNVPHVCFWCTIPILFILIANLCICYLNLMRTIKEALYIRVNDPSLNRNVGKYHLPHVWDEVLFNTSELKLK